MISLYGKWVEVGVGGGEKVEVECSTLDSRLVNVVHESLFSMRRN